MSKILLRSTGALVAALLLGHSHLALQQPQVTPLARLQANIERITRSVNAKWGIYIKCIETGEEIAINADETMDTMSVIKIPLMAEVFRQIEAGKFALTDRVTLKETDKRPGTGIIRSLDAGASLTIKDLITLMIIVSDNSATDMLFEKVGGTEPVNKLMQSYGLNTIKATGPTDVWFKAIAAEPDRWKFHTEGKTPFGLSSSREMGKLLERIYKGEAVSKKADEQMIANNARSGLQLEAAEVRHRVRSAAQDGRLSSLHRQRRRDTRKREPPRCDFGVYGSSQRHRTEYGGRDWTDRRTGRELLCVSGERKAIAATLDQP